MERSLVLLILSFSIFFPILSLNTTSSIYPYHILNLQPCTYEYFNEQVRDGLFVVYYSSAPIYFVVNNLEGITLFSIQSSSYYGCINLPPGEYKVLFINNVSKTYVTIQIYIGDGRPYPTGIADYGIQVVNGVVKPYVEKFDEVVGVAQIYSISAYNASLNSYGASLQLNTVLQVNTLYGSQEYWLQNVIGFMTNTSEYRFVDNIWNLTSYPSELNSSSIIGKGYVCWFIEGLGINYYYGYATEWFNMSYPLNVALFIRVSTVPQGVEVLFGYINSTSCVIYDNVTIKVPCVTSAYLLVSGYNTTGSRHAYDTEFVFGGEKCGEVTSFNSLNAIIYMFYVNGKDVFTPKTLFPFGIDTAEASNNLFTVPYNGAYKVEVGERNEAVLTNSGSPIVVKVNGSRARARANC
ncbi:MAG: thermopsin [Acidianus infernus]|nr:thermopsin [Acidianus infernus]